VLPNPLVFTHNEFLLTEVAMLERITGKRLSYDEAVAYDVLWNDDVERMHQWIDFQLADRSTLSKKLQ
jgi:hypothetical protein